MRQSIETFQRQLNGYRDGEGRRHSGFLDSVERLESASDRARIQSEANAAMIKKIAVGVIIQLIVLVIGLAMGKIHF